MLYNKLSKGQKRRMKKQQKRQQALLEQEFEELEEIECREQEQRLREMGLLYPPAEGDTACADNPKSSTEQHDGAAATSSAEAELSPNILPSGEFYSHRRNLPLSSLHASSGSSRHLLTLLAKSVLPSFASCSFNSRCCLQRCCFRA